MEEADGVGDAHGITPLQPISPDRANHQLHSSARSNAHRDSRIHDKIRQFNNLSHLPPNPSSMSKQLERMTADAALKRAMIGREEAEAEMRRYREEARALRKQVEEGRERERRVGERLETVMENYGRAKETYAHTQAIWEKEIRRARKESFKAQSSIVKLQEELKAVRTATKSAEECLEREKQLSKAREHEAFASRSQLVGVQEELEKAMERIKFLEEERDAFKSVAQGAEAARLAELLPLPPEDPESEFATPRKRTPRLSMQGRESLSAFEIASSAATEAELEELTRLWQWEKQRADRTQEHLEFVEAEFEILSSRPKAALRESRFMSPRREPPTPLDPSDFAILGREPGPGHSSTPEASTGPRREEGGEFEEETTVIVPVVAEPPEDDVEVEVEVEVKEQPAERSEPRRGTIFVPAEGIFRTISQIEFEAAETEEENKSEPAEVRDAESDPPRFSRTPSVEPPSFALMAQERTSLLSLLDAPRESEAPCHFEVPSITGDASECVTENPSEPETDSSPVSVHAGSALETRPHTSTSFYTVRTTTTTIPMKDDAAKSHSAPLVPPHGRSPSFDVNNPALTPTMTREQALAQIRERRGRARSAMQGAMTPLRQMVVGVGDRNVSAPAAQAAKSRT
ncbi:hypothetical protein GGS20DRAFT_86808 [Poronia punctata]|nr:hypothetical protein GGS20DRAFT_86808 [Poronia punctata]